MGDADRVVNCCFVKLFAQLPFGLKAIAVQGSWQKKLILVNFYILAETQFMD